MFKFINTPIDDLFVIEINKFEDSRGYFMERYKRSLFFEMGIKEEFVQDNMSWSCKSTIRGLHYQTDPKAQGKLVSCLYGEILDVAVDLRKDSPTYMESFSVLLNEATMLYVPAGFAHGFSVPDSNRVLVCYKCTNEYSKEHEGGLRYDDPKLNIDWKVTKGEELVSAKDKELPYL
jgi:dTDP-4-dehydrorhamnose 3,5-epimerase